MSLRVLLERGLRCVTIKWLKIQVLVAVPMRLSGIAGTAPRQAIHQQTSKQQTNNSSSLREGVAQFTALNTG